MRIINKFIDSLGAQTSHSRQEWFVASAIAAIGSLPVAIYGDSAPWLIAIPITVGAVVLAAMKLLTTKDGSDS